MNSSAIFKDRTGTRHIDDELLIDVTHMRKLTVEVSLDPWLVQANDLRKCRKIAVLRCHREVGIRRIGSPTSS